MTFHRVAIVSAAALVAMPATMSAVVTVTSLSQLRQHAAASDTTVKLAPGTYALSGDTNNDGTGDSRIFLNLTGSNDIINHPLYQQFADADTGLAGLVMTGVRAVDSDPNLRGRLTLGVGGVAALGVAVAGLLRRRRAVLS